MKSILSILIFVMLSSTCFAGNNTGGGGRPGQFPTKVNLFLDEYLKDGVFRGNINKTGLCSVEVVKNEKKETMISIKNFANVEVAKFNVKKLEDGTWGSCPRFVKRANNFIHIQKSFYQQECLLDSGNALEDHLVIKKRGPKVQFIIVDNDKTETASCKVSMRVLK